MEKMPMPNKKGLYMTFGKRILDIFLSSIGLILLSPLFAVLALWIALDSPGPIFFRQKRVSAQRSYFTILKFRTMRADTPKDVPTHEMENPGRWITASGCFLRKTSLDELPQLINILKGEMSVIGPRPALWNQADLLDERDQYGVNDLIPGLTGYAQIHGRDELEIHEKARLDGYYAAHFGFVMDCLCFFGTIASVLRHEGVVEGGTGELQKNGEYRR